MIKNFSGFEVKAGERIYRFLCDFDAPIGEIHDVLMQMKSKAVEIINAAENQGKKEEEPQEQPKEE